LQAEFNSTMDAIIEENDLEDPNAIFVGQQLVIPANIVTATATRPADKHSRLHRRPARPYRRPRHKLM
jgi:LysM repeat protein